NRLVTPVSTSIGGITMTVHGLSVAGGHTFVNFTMDNSGPGGYTVGGGGCPLEESRGRLQGDRRGPLQGLAGYGATPVSGSFEYVLGDNETSVTFDCLTPGPDWKVQLQLHPAS